MKLCYQAATPDVAIADSVTAYQGSLTKTFGDLGALGYDGVELMTLNPGKLDWREVKETAEENNLSVVLVCTGEIFGQLGLSYTHPDRSLRREAVERTKEIIDFAGYLGVNLRIVEVNNDIDTAIGRLQSGKYDLLAVSLTQTPERNEQLRFSKPLFQTREVLVQNKNSQPRRERDLYSQKCHLV